MPDEGAYRNLRFRETNAFAGIGVFAFLYVVPGIVLGRYIAGWAGFAFMGVGAALFVAFAWRCLYPVTLIFDRDGIRMRCPLPGRFFVSRNSIRVQRQYTDTLTLGYEEMHEAAWRRSGRWARKMLGPLVFVEPLWFLQFPSDRALVIMRGADPVKLREDEFGDLSDLAESLKKHGVSGMAVEGARPLQVFGGNP